jgi:hypothetical protein
VIVSPEAFATIRISGFAAFEAVALVAEALAAEAFVVVVLDAAAGLIGVSETGEAIDRRNSNLHTQASSSQRGMNQEQVATNGVGALQTDMGKIGTRSLSLVLSTVLTDRPT